MPVRYIVIGQDVARQVVEAAKYLRQNQTEAERVLWERLRACRFGGWKFRRQQVIGTFIVDFYCHKAGLVIELDGGYHDDPDQDEYDGERDEALAVLGLRVMRVSNDRILDDLEAVLAEIKLACDLCAG